jgi:hypothetical protein
MNCETQKAFWKDMDAGNYNLMENAEDRAEQAGRRGI